MILDSKYLYKRLLTHTAPYWKAFALSILATIILGLSEPAIPAILGPLLDGSFVANDADLALKYSVFLVALFTLRGIVQYAGQITMTWVGNKVVMDLREKMLHKLLIVSTQFYDHRSSGALLSKFTYDAYNVAEATTGALVILVRDSITVIGLLAFMLYTDWKLAIIFFLIIPFVGLIVKAISIRLRLLNLALQESVGEMNTIIDEVISGNKEIKLFGGKNFEQDRFHRTVNWIRRYIMKTAITSTASIPVVQLLTVAALAIIINVAALGEPPMSPGTFMAFFGAMGLLLPPIKRLTSVTDPLQRGLAAAESIFTLIDEENEPDDGQKQINRAQGRLEFRHVNFRYPQAEQAALKDINIIMQPGETIALVGQSGSGKSTIANLIPRFYQPESGEILLDNTNIQELKLADLRSNISLVSQNVVLFNDTLAANIAYGNSEIGEASIIEAAKKAHAWEFIKKLPKGLQTRCGQDGALLSGGQRQRIAIARALLKDAPILILDEATSALDTQSEHQVQTALEELQHGRTTITIAHRLSTIEKADRIVVMDQGRIVETGTHTELLEKGGYYADLHRIQFSTQNN